MKLEDFDKKLFKNKKFRQEYYKYDLAFEIGEMLVEARILRGLTQAKLAKIVNTKQSGIARAESGTRLPSLSFLEKIANALRTNLIIKFDVLEPVNIQQFDESSNQDHQFLNNAQADQFIDKPIITSKVETRTVSYEENQDGRLFI